MLGSVATAAAAAPARPWQRRGREDRARERAGGGVQAPVRGDGDGDRGGRLADGRRRCAHR